MIKQIKDKYTGIIICLVVAMAAGALASRYEAPIMLFALLLGLTLHFLYESPQHQEGIIFAHERFYGLRLLCLVFVLRLLILCL